MLEPHVQFSNPFLVFSRSFYRLMCISGVAAGCGGVRDWSGLRRGRLRQAPRALLRRFRTQAFRQ